MLLYLFHLRDQDELHANEVGVDLPDVFAALQEALRVDWELAAEPVGLYGLEYVIKDESGRFLLKVPI